jgi:hypothetical protein
MKKLRMILALLVIAVNVNAQVGITKVGDLIKFTGVGTMNSPLATTNTTIYLANIDIVRFTGNDIRFERSGSGRSYVDIYFPDVTDKLSMTTSATYVDKLVELGYIQSTVNAVTSDTLEVSNGDTTITYQTNPKNRPWSVQVMSTDSIDSPITVDIWVSNDGTNFVALDDELTGTITDDETISFAGEDISHLYFRVKVVVGSATIGKYKIYAIL